MRFGNTTKLLARHMLKCQNVIVPEVTGIRKRLHTGWGQQVRVTERLLHYSVDADAETLSASELVDMT